MRRDLVKTGLNLLITAICMVTAATFFHGEVANMFLLSMEGETSFIFYGLFWGALFGCMGILVAVAGLLRRRGAGSQAVSLKPTLMVLALITFLFFYLLYSSFHAPAPDRLRPGETITI